MKKETKEVDCKTITAGERKTESKKRGLEK